ncbi:b(0,+)-type amino acid transporter 1 Short=b(0,+)AT1; AltName: Full=Glycoprotein-associated amino acid transporter b0,+AT1; AltName: Full=Solute carrier family 7 member 9 [Serendipita indica DSM 11827]|nr:b(0,+)-type amino acid transporter 1 Short=b(0,+)AT1; AltName: Full=Glycoprotein-associated amino acid transporter b0,+AT1; AltName: Full=Solute carrier family 7 member 9 [Serendipita indica DSM 11827]
MAHSPSSPRSRASSSGSSTSLRALEFSEGAQRAPHTPTHGFGPSLGHRPRLLSVSTPTTFAFDFQGDLLPISLSESAGESTHVAEKTIGLVNGVALVVGNQIGSGIFSSPGVVLADSGSVGASLMVWVVSGILAWTGASSFAELGSAIPLSGGAQAYLAYAYHPIVSYLFSWTAISVLKPGSNAIIALIFGEYLNRLFFHATSAAASPDSLPDWANKLMGCIAVIIVSVLCVATPRLATRVAVLFTSVKIAALIAVAVMGFITLARGKISSSFREPLYEGTSPNPSAYALALFSGLWAYEGWDQANYITGEMKDPAKNMPRVIHSSMTTVTLLFLFANVSYFLVLDKDTVSRSNTIALDFGRALFGPAGAIIFACMVAVSCFGALNGAFFTSSRLICAAGREGFLPELFGHLHPVRKTPLNATILQAVLTLFFVIFGGGFRSLVNFYSVASWGFYFLTVLGLVVLRIKEPFLERPYRTYITTPLIFCGVALFLLSMPIVAAPLEALSAIGFIAAGVPVYFLTQSKWANQPDGFVSRVKGWIATAWAFSLDRSSQLGRGGWTRLATEGDPDEVEMHAAPR